MAVSTLTSSSSSRFSAINIQGKNIPASGSQSAARNPQNLSEDAVSVQLNSKPQAAVDAATYSRRPTARPQPTPAQVDAAAGATKPAPTSDQGITVNGLFGKDGSITLDSGLTGKYEEVGNGQIKFSVGGFEGLIDRTSGRGIAKDSNGNEISFDYSEGKDGLFQAKNLKAYERANKPEAKVAFQGSFDEKGFEINGVRGTYAQQSNGNIAFEIGGFRGQVDTSGRGTAFDKDGNIFEFQASYDGKNGFSITGLTGGR